jgi:hypothetical protein
MDDFLFWIEEGVANRNRCRCCPKHTFPTASGSASLVSQSHSRIDSRGPSCGNITRRQRHCCE